MDIRSSRMDKHLGNKKIRHKVKEIELHSDERGWLAEVLKRNEIKEDIKQIYVATIKPGYIRGNHYHLERTEWFFVVGGRANLYLGNPENKENICLEISSGKPKVITIFPKTAHAVKNTGEETIYLVSARNTIYDPENTDTFYYSLCEK